MLRMGKKTDLNRLTSEPNEIETSQDVIDVYENLTEKMEELYDLMKEEIANVKRTIYSPSGCGQILNSILVAISKIDNSTGFLKQTDVNVFLKTLIDLTTDVTGVLPAANGGRGVRSSTTTNLATLTPNADSYDMYALTAQTDTLVMANPTGTPIQGQKLIVRIYTAAAETITWSGAQYRSVMGSALPVLTVAGMTLYLGFIWNIDLTKWDLVATAQEAA